MIALSLFVDKIVITASILSVAAVAEDGSRGPASCCAIIIFYEMIPASYHRTGNGGCDRWFCENNRKAAA